MLMMMDKDLLIYHIRRAGETVEELAQALGIHPVTLRGKMTGIRSDFTRKEIQKISDRYKLTPEELKKVFFPEEGK